MELKNRSFLKLLDYTPAEIGQLLELAADLKAKKKAGIRHDQLRGKNIALIFEKPRTTLAEGLKRFPLTRSSSKRARPPPAPAAALRSPPTIWAWK